MQPLPDMESVWRLHQDTVARVNRDGYRLAYRDEALRLRRQERLARRRPRRRWAFPLHQALQRLRLA